MALIFLVEDNESIREAVASYLRLEEHEVLEFERVQGVLEAVEHKAPDLVILDVMLPDGNGFLLAKKIRKASEVPLFFLTARTEESDRITGFEIGADDYIVKPFSPKELTLRVRSLLRRLSGSSGDREERTVFIFQDHRLQIDHESHQVFLDAREIQLTSSEWKILDYLSFNAGIVISREKLLGECLDYLAEGSERTIDTHIKNLRAKLGDIRWIQTVRGYGYRFLGQKTG